MNQVEIVVALLIVVAALAIVAKRIALPYPVLLVVAGPELGFLPGPPPNGNGIASSSGKCHILGP